MLASLAHRASGMMLVLFIPVYLWLLHAMTGAPEDFAAARAWLHLPLGRIVLWLVGASLIYHIVNGVRFLCLDAGWGESREMMRFTARVTIGIGVVAVTILGVALW
ncbi:MAG: succinate dehydrogenase, cytochrome b556 subunit [Zetaproteobacteria bacterium]|nr:MAG: succinate dehydrogenase, cytochrome b556 subunit [Zetaproteobacteria bacterium]